MQVQTKMIMVKYIFYTFLYFLNLFIIYPFISTRLVYLEVNAISCLNSTD